MTDTQQAEAVVGGLAGDVVYEGKRWWHIRPTRVRLTAQQHAVLTDDGRWKFAGFRWVRRCCLMPVLNFVACEQRTGFAPKTTHWRSACSVCGWTSDAQKL